MRLIDADALIEVLKNSVSLDIQDQIITENNINVVMSMPTAYSVEKVIAELEAKLYWSPDAYDEEGHFNLDTERVVNFYDAIDIVKRGGVE